MSRYLNKSLGKYSLAGRQPIKLELSSGICDLPDRAAMGLPNHYVAGTLEELNGQYSDFFNYSHSDLAIIVESEEYQFSERYVAGQILALIGDPRIATLEPKMMEIPEWSGWLGLDKDKIDGVVKLFSDLGVLRSWIEKEAPEYKVDIESFRLGKYQVTNHEYLGFLTDTRYHEIPSSWPFGQFPSHMANHPVYTLSVDACMDYTKWLSEKTGRLFRLPTEAEWEYAAGGPMRFEYPWGNEFLPDHANTVETGIFMSTAVGCFPLGRSQFGCMDMAGNVEEYVSDFYCGYGQTAAVHDDLVEVNGDKYRVARGGGFTRFHDLARTRRRHGPNPKSIYVMGFRLAETRT